jgi:hypothetical protein
LRAGPELGKLFIFFYVSKVKFGKFYEKGKLFFEVFAPSEKFFDKSMKLWAIKGRFEEFTE